MGGVQGGKDPRDRDRGIQSAGDALEFLLVGAAAVQVGTANFRNPNACMEIIEGIREFMVREKLKSLDEYRGGFRP